MPSAFGATGRWANVRALDAESLADTPVLPVSARTGEGLGDLRALLIQTVRRNRAVTDRIAADIDGVIGGFEPYAGPQVAPDAAMADAAFPPASPPVWAAAARASSNRRWD